MRVILKQFSNNKIAFDKKEALNGVAPAKDGSYAKGDDKQIQNVLNTAYLWAGIIAVGIIIVSGIYYTISSGDAGKVKRAKDALMYSVVGLIIVMIAFAITNFVIGKV